MEEVGLESWHEGQEIRVILWDNWIKKYMKTD